MLTEKEEMTTNLTVAIESFDEMVLLCGLLVYLKASRMELRTHCSGLRSDLVVMVIKAYTPLQRFLPCYQRRTQKMSRKLLLEMRT